MRCAHLRGALILVQIKIKLAAVCCCSDVITAQQWSRSSQRNFMFLHVLPIFSTFLASML